MSLSPNTSNPLAGQDPQDISVVIVAHGDRGGPDPGSGSGARRNQALERHRAHLAKNGAFRHVAAGVLKGSPTLEDAVAEARAASPKAIAFYPFFMADGYFVKNVLPQRLVDYGLALPHHSLQPLGHVPKLVDMIVAQALACAFDAQIEAKQARLLLAGHGSKYGPASANATRAAAQNVKGTHANAFAEVDVAFLEEAPFLRDQLAGATRTTIVSGFFNGDGLHAGEDVPAALREAATCGGSQTIYTGPIGAAAEISDLIQAEILAALSPQET